MREAIERVIADLEQEALQATMRADFADNENVRAMYVGRMLAMGEAITQLKEVLSQYETSDTDRTNGNGTNDSRDGQADQI